MIDMMCTKKCIIIKERNKMDTKKCIAELQWVKEYGFFLDRNMPGVDDIIEALEEGIQALRKQIPREPIEKQVHLNS